MSDDQVTNLFMAAAMVGGWLAEHAVALAAPAVALAAWWTAMRLIERRRLRRTPAAADNVPPTDIDALIACRRIDREPLADPDTSRRIIRYLRDNAGEENTP